MVGDFIPHQDGAFLEWAKTLLAYAAPYTFTFDEAERGRALYICPRWEKAKGIKARGEKFIRLLCRKYGRASASHIPPNRWYMRRKGQYRELCAIVPKLG
jgi:hypothetical protein